MYLSKCSGELSWDTQFPIEVPIVSEWERDITVIISCHTRYSTDITSVTSGGLQWAPSLSHCASAQEFLSITYISNIALTESYERIMWTLHMQQAS